MEPDRSTCRKSLRFRLFCHFFKIICTSKHPEPYCLLLNPCAGYFAHPQNSVRRMGQSDPRLEPGPGYGRMGGGA